MNKIYKWEVIDFTTIGAIANALTILIAVPNMWLFSDILKMSDPEMVAACFFCYSLKYGLLSIAKWSIYFYYARELFLRRLRGHICQSRVGQSKEDVGTVSAETLVRDPLMWRLAYHSLLAHSSDNRFATRHLQRSSRGCPSWC